MDTGPHLIIRIIIFFFFLLLLASLSKPELGVHCHQPSAGNEQVRHSGACFRCGHCSIFCNSFSLSFSNCFNGQFG